MNKLDEILNILSDLLGDYKKTSGQNYAFFCPFCHHRKKKLEIKIDENNLQDTRWHCWVCDSKGRNVYSLLHYLGADRLLIKRIIDLCENDGRYYIENEDINLPKEEISLPEDSVLVYPYNPKYGLFIDYLRTRNINDTLIIKYDIRACMSGEYSGRIIIPSYDCNNKLNYFVSRTIYDSSYKKYKNPSIDKSSIIFFENKINWNFPIILCEGVFDAITIDLNSIPLLGKTLSAGFIESILKKNVKDVYVYLDNDAQDEIYDIALKLMSNGLNVYHVVPSSKDASEEGRINALNNISSAKKIDDNYLFSLKLKNTIFSKKLKHNNYGYKVY
ncbi:MAG: hypothetical protein IRZ03_13150 [Acidobacterium ailaaui]|nr:hypothetical protein [Pseudacidobacterium ailaaui]